VFACGDVADRLYYVASGAGGTARGGQHGQAGQMFGEIAFFAPGHRRSSSARCLSDCTLLSIDETTFRELVYQNPDFGLEVVRLIAGRLSEDVRRLQSRQARRRPDYTGASRNRRLGGPSRPTSLICPLHRCRMKHAVLIPALMLSLAAWAAEPKAGPRPT
jgi:CRP-like cAMP-binding protein